MNKNAPLVYIIILNWNGWQDTLECLESLMHVTYKNFCVVVVDNASRNDSIERIEQWAENKRISLDTYELSDRVAGLVKIKGEPPLDANFKKLHLICSKTNLGFCAGNNVGMEFAVKNGADYLLILNNDTVCEPDFIEPLIDVAESQEDAGLIGGIICYAEKPEVVQSIGGKLNMILEGLHFGNKRLLNELLNEYPTSFITDWISGCMTFIPKKVYELVGGYNEALFIWAEDLDLTLRVKELGFKLYVTTGSRIYHKTGMSLGRITPMTHYYANRNRLILKKWHLGPFRRFVFYLWYLASRLVRYTQFALKGRFDLISAGIDAIRDYYRGKYGKWSKHRE